jgi:spore maturation protein CgeB
VRYAFFYHSVRSDWNQGNAHFLRGLVRALTDLGHRAVCYEEAAGWSVTNLVAGAGLRPLVEFRRRFPFIDVRLYTREPARELEQSLRAELAGVDVVVLHEWPAAEHPALLEALLRLRRDCGFRLLFHDTHYRVLTQPVRMARLALERCDAILAYSPSLAAAYRDTLGLSGAAVHVFHEGADTAIFRPRPPDPARPTDDAVFVGNWGGPDRAAELRAFVFGPARRFHPRRRFALYGVRYPPEILADVRARCGVDYRGWLPNHRVPDAFAQARVVLHVPRRQYARLLYGTPTIRVFEALACGAPLVSTPWVDTDGLFRAGEDYLVVDTPAHLEGALEWLWRDDAARRRLAESGERRILAAHTCRHRADQLQAIVAGLGAAAGRSPIRLPAPAPAPFPDRTPAGYLDDSSEIAAGD